MNCNFIDPLAQLSKLIDIGEKRESPCDYYPVFHTTESDSYYTGGAVQEMVLRGATGQDVRNQLVLGSIVDCFPVLLGRQNRTIYMLVTDNGGGWAEYMQHLNKYSKGYCMADRRGTDIDYEVVQTDTCKFSPFYGEDSSGDFDKHSSVFANYIIEEIGKRVMLTLCDSFIADPLIFITTSCSVLAPGGCMVLKVTKIDDGLIYSLCLLFEAVTIFRSLLQDVYLVCMNYSGNSDVVSILKEGKRALTTNVEFKKTVEDAVRSVNDIPDWTIDEMTVRRKIGY